MHITEPCDCTPVLSVGRTVYSLSPFTSMWIVLPQCGQIIPMVGESSRNNSLTEIPNTPAMASKVLIVGLPLTTCVMPDFVTPISLPTFSSVHPCSLIFFLISTITYCLTKYVLNSGAKVSKNSLVAKLFVGKVHFYLYFANKSKFINVFSERILKIRLKMYFCFDKYVFICTFAMWF